MKTIIANCIAAVTAIAFLASAVFFAWLAMQYGTEDIPRTMGALFMAAISLADMIAPYMVLRYGI